MARKADLVAQCKNMIAKDGGMSEDEQAVFDGNIAEIDGIDRDIKRLDAIESVERAVSQNQPRKTSHNSTGRVVVGRDRAEDDPKAGFRSPREFVGAVMMAGSGGGGIDPRLSPLRVGMAAGSDEHGEYSDSYGGFLVPAAYQPTLLKTDPEPDPIAGRTRLIPMSSPTVEIPARTDKNHTTSVSGGLTVSRRSETTAAATSRMATERVVLKANSLFGAAFATEEILTDSAVSFQAILADSFAEEFRSNHIKECLNGTGVGEYEGINTSGAMVTVPKETGQVANTIVYDNILKMRSRCWGYANAVWLANHDTMPQLAKLSASVGVAGELVYHFSAVEDVPDMLMGRPIYYTEYCETLGTAGDVVLANWGEYLEGTLQTVQGADSVHVRFLEHERVFKFWTRNDGRSWWRTPLTPNKSANTLSPFVRLATRA